MKREINEEMLTAYVLGEASDQDKKDVEQAIEVDASTRMILEELKMAADKSTKALEDAEDSSLKLTDSQRDDVMKEASAENVEVKSPRPEKSPFDRSPQSDSPFDAGPLGGGLFDGGKDENSGLYSLSNLDSLSTEDDAGAGIEINPVQPGWDGESSGLIDIRSMTAGKDDTDDSGVNELLSLGGTGFAAPPGSSVLAAAREGLSLKVKIGIGVAALAFVGMLVTVVAVLSGSDGNDETALQLAALQQQLTDMQKSGGSADDIEALKEQLLKAEETKEEQAEGEAEEEKAEDEAKSKSKSKSKSSAKVATAKKSAGSDAKASAEDDEEYEEEERPKASRSKKGAGNDALDSLLGGSMSGPKKRSSSSSRPSGAKAGLDRSDVVKGMKGVSSAVKRCGQGSHGKVTLKIIIGSTGRVQSATPTGEFAGTPIGTCAARAVRKASFPRSQKNLTVTYPFKF
jgi:hypothetical protein